MGDELVKVVAADQAVQVVEEVEALFVGNLAVDILGVDVLVADDELGVLMVLAKLLDCVLEALPADDGGKVKLGVAVEAGADAALEVDGPALVQPAAVMLALGGFGGVGFGISYKCSQLALDTRLPLQLWASS